jgi:creatinine amidohydrolase/Fe(II)-dependent formamide hydrolase-like protein
MVATAIRELQHLTAFEISMLPREKTVFFICVGSLVDKGPHLPVDSSMRTARALANASAVQLLQQLPEFEVIFLPALPLSVASASSELFLRVRGHVLRDALVDQCQALARLGFKWFVCFSDERSPQQLTTLEEAGTILSGRTAGWRGLWGRWIESVPGVGSRRATLVSACSALIERSELWRAPLWPDPLENGGKEETSRLLASEPAAVRPEYIRLPSVSRPASRGERFRQWWGQTRRGYWGSPAEATAQQGLKGLESEAVTIALKLRAVFSGTPGHIAFRSGFGLFPTNRSLFSVWILGLALAMILTAWVIWSVRWMVQGG